MHFIIVLASFFLQCALLQVDAVALPNWPADFKWSQAGKPNGYDCIQIHEAADTAVWRDNYFCWVSSKANPGFKWSSSGSIANMRCEQILELADPHTWTDNYLCVPMKSPYWLSWSMAGRIAGKKCIQWLEAGDKQGTWTDNFLCAA